MARGRNEGATRIEQVEYHRNGISGEDFHVVTFTDEENGPMVGIVFAGKGRVAVLNRELLQQGNIAYGSNSWRGDCYEADLREAVDTYRKEVNERLGYVRRDG